ncbi:MAG: ABC transporter permease, partial [Planctomycetota bacterium]
RGSPLELVLNSLYFGADVPERMPHAAARDLRETGLAEAVPLYVRFRSQNDPIVGTTLDYFRFRDRRIAAGRQMMRLGDCVIGAEVARRRGVGPGDSLLSSPENVFDLAGVYPLKMRIAGVLAFTDGPDDHAIFVDLKTAWIIEGLAHGHQDLAESDAAAGVLRRDGRRITANASVVEFNEITDENIGTFHFHGDPESFPITAVIAIPPDRKSAALLRGRYESNEAALQIVRPGHVMDELLATILTVQSFVLAAVMVVGVATLATVALVFALSLRLRRREIATMTKIGGARARIASVLIAEVALVIAISTGLAGLLTWTTGLWASNLVRMLVLQ